MIDDDDWHPADEVYGRKTTRGERAAITRGMNEHRKWILSLPITDPRRMTHELMGEAALMMYNDLETLGDLSEKTLRFADTVTRRMESETKDYLHRRRRKFLNA